MLKTFCIIFFIWTTCITSAQEYLPPKSGYSSKNAPQEPMLPANYNFSYAVQDNTLDKPLDFGHNENRKDNQVTGSYHVLLPDGRTQLVEYEAGPEGYKPQIMYMGTATYGPSGGADKFDGYHYNAASNRQLVRQPAPRPLPLPRAPSAASAPHVHSSLAPPLDMNSNNISA